MIPADKTKADANPTKAFFVRMITRDITLEDCIFDLIDNSIDGARKLSGEHPLTLDDQTNLGAFKISVNIDQNQFSISDNCGGITLDDAVEYAFTFGRKETDAADGFSIGVYGIGMKRAVFKIGSEIEIRSTYQDASGTNAFKVPINVDAWLAAPEGDWDFDIEEDVPLPDDGVHISVTSLTDAATRSFESPRFVQNLRRIIARDYALHLQRGLIIEINGKPIQGWSIQLRESGDFAPLRARFTETFEGDEVIVELLAGMIAPPPDTSEPSDDLDDNEDRSGWYVICNGRIVLAADKTRVSGWGTEGWPVWHPQYAGFLGILLFSSKRTDLLPLTTTKRSVDETSAIYRMYRPRMRDTTKAWTTYTNVRKNELVEARQKEEAARPVAIANVAMRSAVELPKILTAARSLTANVTYAVPVSRLRRLATELGNINMTNKEVGRRSFDHTYKDLTGDE